MTTKKIQTKEEAKKKLHELLFLDRRRRCSGNFTFLGRHCECDSSPFTFMRKRRRI